MAAEKKLPTMQITWADPHSSFRFILGARKCAEDRQRVPSIRVVNRKRLLGLL